MSVLPKYQGVLEVYKMGGPTYFWVENLHPLYFFGQETCHIFQFIKICEFFWLYTSPSNVFVVVSGSEIYGLQSEVFSETCLIE